jgi:hypothetical protein
MQAYGMDLDSVADPHHFDADPDLAFHFDPDPDPTFHFDADPDPTLQTKGSTLGEGSNRLIFHSFRLVACKLLRIRIQLFTLMLIRILPFILMRIRIRNTGSGTSAIDVLFSFGTFHFPKNFLKFPLSTAKLIGDYIDNR